MFFSMRHRELGDLLRLARTGVREAWEELVVRHQSLVYGTARRSGLDEEAARDVTQDVFLILYRNLDRIEESAALPKWLAVVSARQAFRHARLHGKTVSLESSGLDQVLISEEAEADELAEQSLALSHLREAISKLDDRCRRLLEAIYVEEASYKDISERHKMPLGAIGPTRGRCLEKLRKLSSPNSDVDVSRIGMVDT